MEDDDEEKPINLIELYQREIEAKAKRSEVKCRDVKLAVQHVRVFASEFSQHTIHLCAHDRDVQHLPLANFIPYIPPRFKDAAAKPFVYKGYVSGDFLDRRVNAERTAFDLRSAVNGGRGKIKNRIDDLVAKNIQSIEPFCRPSTHIFASLGKMRTTTKF